MNSEKKSILVASEHELKLRVSRSSQAKLLAAISKTPVEGIDVTIQKLKAIFDFGEFDFTHEPIIGITDRYYDTKNFDLLKIQSSLRIREIDGGMEFTAKKMRGREKGEFVRDEHTIKLKGLSDPSAATKLMELAASVFPEIANEPLIHLLDVINQRRNFGLKRRGEMYRLSLDLFSMVGSKSGQSTRLYLELEIEALNTLGMDKLGEIKRNLTRILHTLSYSENSKYELGVTALGLNRIWKIQFLGKMLGTEMGISQIGLLVGLLGILLAIFFYFFPVE